MKRTNLSFFLLSHDPKYRNLVFDFELIDFSLGCVHCRRSSPSSGGILQVLAQVFKPQKANRCKVFSLGQ